MKKLKLIYTMLFAAGISLTNISCKDYLDKSPSSDIDPVDPYKNYTNFQGFMDEVYNCIPLLTSCEYHSCWNFGEDEYWQPSETRMLTNAIDQGNYWGWDECYYSYFHSGFRSTTNSGRFDNIGAIKNRLWGNSWYAIYKCNLGLENLDKLTDATQEEKNIIAGQLYFFRGFYHFMLMQYWGGLPYIDFLIPADAVFNYPRLNYQQTADKAAADFQKAADLLPTDWDKTTVGKATLGKNKTRANKIMALAFLGKDLLYAGSPLMNKESTGDENYNKEYCKKAAEAFGQVLKLCQETGQYQLADFSNYSEIFYTSNQNYKVPGLKEAIFFENCAGDWVWNMVTDFRPAELIQSGIKVYPTANYVDYFGMANGKPIKDITQKDADSGYDPEYPFKDRDPRFYTNFIYDGVKCVKNGAKVSSDPNIQYASLYEGGKLRVATPAKDCFTGYMLMKFTEQYRNDFDDGGARSGSHKMILSLIRLADVYLMYSEAVAQGYGDFTKSSQAYNLSALDAVNKIRERAGVPGIADEYLTSMDGFMSELRRERAVELAYEGHRFNDLRRWLLLDKAPYTQKTAVYFDRATDQSNDDRFAEPDKGHVLNLREEPLVTRKFTYPKHYWFPFLKNDVQMYEAFTQNPGWE